MKQRDHDADQCAYFLCHRTRWYNFLDLWFLWTRYCISMFDWSVLPLPASKLQIEYLPTTSKTSASISIPFSQSTTFFESDSYVSRVHCIQIHKFRPQGQESEAKRTKNTSFWWASYSHNLREVGTRFPWESNGFSWKFEPNPGMRFLKMILETVNYKQTLTFL